MRTLSKRERESDVVVVFVGLFVCLLFLGADMAKRGEGGREANGGAFVRGDQLTGGCVAAFDTQVRLPEIRGGSSGGSHFVCR